MGLAITRSILAVHGGGIEAASVPGHGASFRSGCRWWRKSRNSRYHFAAVTERNVRTACGIRSAGVLPKPRMKP